MKKYVSIFIITFLLLSMTACRNKAVSTTSDVPVATVGVTDDVAKENSSEQDKKLDFSTTDINGKSISDEDIKDAKLIMVNFWEPWCGPCVGEMPELEKLYQNYKEKGFIILGVFHSSDSLDDAKAIVDDNHITYPIVMGNEDFAKFTTEYVPATVFFDSEGNLLNSEPLIGAKSYDEWEQEILKYIKD